MLIAEGLGKGKHLLYFSALIPLFFLAAVGSKSVVLLSWSFVRGEEVSGFYF